jgi:DNA-directed RNA polymerase specialized sigma24 family protein
MEHIRVACVDSYIQRYGWGLITRDDLLTLVEQACQRHGAHDAAAARIATLACYSAIMHRACSGADGRARQEQGYTELHAFLAAVARRRYANVGAEATQRALERIFVSFASCRQPETFLAFPLQQLRDAARAEFHTELRAAEALPDSDGALATAWQLAAASQRPDPVDTAIRRDILDHIGHCARRFVQRYPRATQQFAALWMRHIEGLDDETIGQRLGTSSAAVQVMRSRAARRLRADPDWQRLAYELGVLS